MLISPEAPVTDVPGTAFGFALVADYVVAVLPLGPPTGQLLLCNVDGEPVSLAGVEVLEAGRFPTSGHGVRYADAVVPAFDIGEQLERFKMAAPAFLGARQNTE